MIMNGSELALHLITYGGQIQAWQKSVGK
jgi:hypothetical protein